MRLIKHEDPVLATAVYTDDNGEPLKIVVEGGLHYLKGNRAPYFGITACVHDAPKGTSLFRKEPFMCGCCHDEIEKCFPGRFSDLIALHLCDPDGDPMYAEENGRYWLDQKNVKYIASHFRLSKLGAKLLMEDYDKARVLFDPELPTMKERAKKFVHDFCESQRPRWAKEAAACIKKHGLVLYGDPYPTPIAQATPEED